MFGDLGAKKENYLGNLSSKTEAELKDLLHRQESLLKNESFVKKLPDKGERVKNLIQRLNTILKEREKINETADMFQKMAIRADDYRRQRERGCLDEEDNEDDELIDPLKQLVNKEISSTRVKDERLEEDTQSPALKFTNSYEVVMRRAQQKIPTEKQTFHPNRTIRSKDITEIPLASLVKLKLDKETNRTEISANKCSAEPGVEKPGHERLNLKNQEKDTSEQYHALEHSDEKAEHSSQCNSNSRMSTASSYESLPGNSHRRLKHRYDESLECEIQQRPNYHESTKVISVEESIHMLDATRKKMMELQAKQATERLAHRLHITTAPFDPEGSRNMLYRTTQEEDEESGDDEEEEDSENEVDYVD